MRSTPPRGYTPPATVHGEEAPPPRPAPPHPYSRHFNRVRSGGEIPPQQNTIFPLYRLDQTIFFRGVNLWAICAVVKPQLRHLCHPLSKTRSPTFPRGSPRQKQQIKDSQRGKKEKKPANSKFSCFTTLEFFYVVLLLLTPNRVKGVLPFSTPHIILAPRRFKQPPPAGADHL